MLPDLGGFIFGGAYTWSGLFFGILTVYKKYNLDLLLEDLLICLSLCQTHFQVFLRWVKHCLKARHWSLNQTQNKWILIKKVKETTCTQTKEISPTGFIKITEILEIDGILILDMEIF